MLKTITPPSFHGFPYRYATYAQLNYAQNIKRFLFSSPYTCDSMLQQEQKQSLMAMEDSIPLILPKISGVQSLNSKSINSAHSQKVLVSENEMPLHRDEEEIMEVRMVTITL